MSNVGIDISAYQADDVPGDWLFIVVKSTEGNTYVNPRFDAQWRNAARTRRGVYHYARPAKSDGATQAKRFSDHALLHGFKPGEDMWQLDVEGALNEGVTGPQWAFFVAQFMNLAL